MGRHLAAHSRHSLRHTLQPVAGADLRVGLPVVAATGLAVVGDLDADEVGLVDECYGGAGLWAGVLEDVGRPCTTR